MVRTKDELLQEFNAIVGENNDDNVIAFNENLADTLATFSDTTDWKKKYEDNDNEWRNKYIARFNQPSEQLDEHFEKPKDEPTPEEERANSISFKDLFG